MMLIAMALWLAAAGGGPTKAETTTGRELEAAFLFNFTRFVTWPPSAFASATAPVVIGVVDADDVKLTLIVVTRDKTVEGRALKVLRVDAGSARSCHIVFVPDSEPPSRCSMYSRAISLLDHNERLTRGCYRL